MFVPLADRLCVPIAREQQIPDELRKLEANNNVALESIISTAGNAALLVTAVGVTAYPGEIVVLAMASTRLTCLTSDNLEINIKADLEELKHDEERNDTAVAQLRRDEDSLRKLLATVSDLMLSSKDILRDEIQKAAAAVATTSTTSKNLLTILLLRGIQAEATRILEMKLFLPEKLQLEFLSDVHELSQLLTNASNMNNVDELAECYRMLQHLSLTALHSLYESLLQGGCRG
ncbi:hypothetical protein EV360DRAFT_75601 [Lentinula raphanica]|nr:hypothetical protein EV360DRAFT_75601 [Lentinula raphanica]